MGSITCLNTYETALAHKQSPQGNWRACNLRMLSYPVLKGDILSRSFNNKEGRECSEASQFPVKILSPEITDKR